MFPINVSIFTSDVRFRKMVGWLQGAPYVKNARESYQHAHQLFTISKMIGDCEHDLFSEELIRTRWLDNMGENQTAWHDQNLPVFTESLFRILHNDTHRKEKSGIYAVQQSMKVHK